MSLEDTISDLTAAVRALTAALAHPVPTLKAFVPDVTHNPPVAKAEVEAPKPAPTQAAPVTAPTVVVEPVPVAESPSRVDYAQVAKAITDTFKADRAKTIAALAKFGAAKGPQLKVEDYAAFLKVLAS